MISKRTRCIHICCFGALALLCAMLTGIACGPSNISLWELLHGAWTGEPGTAATIFYELRLPRVLLAASAGATLSLGGLVFQAVLRNPLAEPYILGISGGAAVGNILGILLGLSHVFLVLGAFSGGLFVLALVAFLGMARRGVQALLLSGVMVNAFCSAIILFLMAIAKSDELVSIMFWFMGDLGSAGLHDAVWMSLSLLPCYGILMLGAHTMNVLLLGEETAQSLGIHSARCVGGLLVIISVMVSGTVAVVGPLGFVGLAVPQALRRMYGPDHRLLVPACIFFGAAYLVGCDVLARVLPENGELPAGVITALIGAPLFILLLRRKG